MKSLILLLISGYQLFLSPLLRQAFGIKCRYGKTCSVYAKEVIEQSGIITGGWMAIKRILNCQPFTKNYEYI